MFHEYSEIIIECGFIAGSVHLVMFGMDLAFMIGSPM